MEAFERSGYRGFLKKDATNMEAQHNYSGAAGDYAMLGDKDAAFADLNKAFFNRTGVLFIKVDPVSQYFGLIREPIGTAGTCIDLSLPVS